ncbi:MAG TPA: hypothetical protein VKZ70_07785 [Burkholderiaceae bacterium]|nr:hypothetical protein [Burkholderiaceae bacterium]
MKDRAEFDAALFKLVILVTAIVVAMFLTTGLVGLAFMPNHLILGLPTEDMTFLMPMAFATLVSAIVLGWYTRSFISRTKR